jgi:dolichol-phosphate mannosyltransferase
MHALDDRAFAARSPAPGRAALAIVIPTLNEADNVALLADRLRDVLDGLAWEAIFVDDDSTDGTAERIAALAAADPRVRLIRRTGRRGLSSAVIEGMAASAAPVLAVMDADLQHDEAILPCLHERVASGAWELACGTRYARGGSIGDWGAGRAWISRTGTLFARATLRAPLSDPMSGYFAVRRDVVAAAFPFLSGAGSKIMLDIIASSPRPLAVYEIPYTFRRRASGETKLDRTTLLGFARLLADKIFGQRIRRLRPARGEALPSIHG